MEALLATLIFSNPVTLSQLAPQPTSVPAQVLEQTENAQLENNLLETPLICGSNQFPSTFSDVYPTDWAYQAVNRQASRAMECFDYLPDHSPVR